jgi:hypothetical protein
VGAARSGHRMWKISRTFVLKLPGGEKNASNFSAEMAPK